MKLSLPIILILAFVCMDLQLSAQEVDSLKYISLKPALFRECYLKDKNAFLIDVREYFEYKKSRIKGAINIPSSGNIDMAADTLNINQSIYLYCTSGFRAKKVAVRLADRGFGSVFNLEGGIKRWKEEGLAVEKKRRKG
ncbi:MAG: rhodanese-like domain-containing protein [Bacteroidetes bacterium]|nr:rhodanese-like domain-containing protein [Bacteroidota bacterium]